MACCYHFNDACVEVLLYTFHLRALTIMTDFFLISTTTGITGFNLANLIFVNTYKECAERLYYCGSFQHVDGIFLREPICSTVINDPNDEKKRSGKTVPFIVVVTTNVLISIALSTTLLCYFFTLLCLDELNI